MPGISLRDAHVFMLMSFGRCERSLLLLELRLQLAPSGVDMFAQRMHDRFSVARFHCLQQATMFCRGTAHSSADHVNEIERVLRPQHLDEMQRLRLPRDRIKLPVKTVVEGAHRFAVATRLCFFKLALKLAQV